MQLAPDKDLLQAFSLRRPADAIFLLFAVLGLLASRGRFAGLRMIVMISFLNFICYFLMFPLVESWDRFFIPFYIFIVVLSVRSVAPPYKSDTNRVFATGV